MITLQTIIFTPDLDQDLDPDFIQWDVFFCTLFVYNSICHVILDAPVWQDFTSPQYICIVKIRKNTTKKYIPWDEIRVQIRGKYYNNNHLIIVNVNVKYTILLATVQDVVAIVRKQSGPFKLEMNTGAVPKDTGFWLIYTINTRYLRIGLVNLPVILF